MKLATLCYVRAHGKTLMVHRMKRKGDVHLNKWNALGGKFEEGETPEQCVVREVREESGFEITNPVMKGFLTFPNFDGADDWYVFVFVATEFTGELQECSEGNLAWIDDGELAALPLWEGDRIFLPWLDGERFFSARFRYEDGMLKDHSVAFYGGVNDV